MPIAADQDYVRHPLNDLFGTKANVRLLRLLAEQIDGAIGAPEAADQTGLTVAGARRALKKLARTGVVERIGGGRAQRFVLNESHELARPIAGIFHAERASYDRWLKSLRHLFEPFTEIEAAWIEELPTQVGQPTHIYVVAPAGALPALSSEVRRRLVELEEEYDRTVEIHTRSSSEASRPSVRDDVILLAGYVAADASAGQQAVVHGDRDARAANMATAIVKLLERDPSLRRRAERHVNLVIEDEHGPASNDLREWRDVLAHYSHARLAELMTSDTPRATRLRQSSPFFAVLDADERDQVLSSATGEKSESPAT